MRHCYQLITTILNIRNTPGFRKGEVNLSLVLEENFIFSRSQINCPYVFIWLFQETYSWETKQGHTKMQRRQISTRPVGTWRVDSITEREAKGLSPLWDSTYHLPWDSHWAWLFWTLLVGMSVRVWNRSTPQTCNLPRTGAACCCRLQDLRGISLNRYTSAHWYFLPLPPQCMALV